MEKFALDKNIKILIYGAAAGGTLLFQKLQQNGYQIVGFVDKRAKEITCLCGLPVYCIEQIKSLNNYEEMIVIISVKNVFEHSRIARDLMKHGVHNIIYKPYVVLKGYANEAQREVFEIHNRLIEQGNCEVINLSKADEIETCLKLPKEYLLCEDIDTQTVFLPLPMLFENRNGTDGFKERNVCFLYPHIQFFHFLQGDPNATFEYYVKYCEMAAEELDTFMVTDAWRENVIRNRAEVYHQMNHAFLFQKDFFVQNAPDVEWNKNGFFNLKSGKHRAAFFASKRLLYIPVRMSRKDAEQWICKEYVEHVNEVLQKQEIFELKAPIEHPYFYQVPCMTENFFYGLCCVLAEHLGKLYYKSPLDHVLDNKKIYVNLDDYGFISRFLRRCGAYVYDANMRDELLVKALERLFRIPNERLGDRADFYHIAIFQIDSVENLREWKKDIHADKYYLLVREDVSRGLKQFEKLYCGIAWGKSTVFGFLEN